MLSKLDVISIFLLATVLFCKRQCCNLKQLIRFLAHLSWKQKTFWSEKLKLVWIEASAYRVDLFLFKPWSQGLGLDYNRVSVFYIEIKLLKISQKPIGQNIWNMCGSILRWSRLKFVQIMISRVREMPQWGLIFFFTWE